MLGLPMLSSHQQPLQVEQPHKMRDKVIKLYFYVNNGNGILNNFRNLFLGVFALYFALKLTSPVLLVLMFVVAIPVLFISGYFNVHYISKKSEELSIKHGTHYTIKQFELIEEQTKLLRQINKKLSRK